jgi:transposase
MMEEAMAARKKKVAFELAHPNAAGIDVGSASHWVAVPGDRDERPVREFRSFTADLEALADWLEACGIDTVAMESTGVYWIGLHELLEARGFTVYLVNARHVRNVSGRKSDVLDCQWLQQLMSFGLLRGAFRPPQSICALRCVVRQRDMLVGYQASHIQHMQKALTQMNLQLAKVISDVAGVTGLAIIRDIVAGERDAHKLAAHRDCRIKASEEDIAKSLQGNWREEHLFALRQALSLYDSYQARIDECDQQLALMLARLQRHSGSPGPTRRRWRAKNAPRFDLRGALYKLAGVDLTSVDGIDVITAMTLLCEVGPDLSRFKSEKHFCSWLGVCPGTKISGGKLLSGATKRSANRAARALKLAAAGLRSSQSALGAYFRRLCARMDRAKAVTAAAHKLARIVYALLTKGQAYVDQGQDYYEERYQQRVLHHLKRKAHKMGFELQPLNQAQPA